MALTETQIRRYARHVLLPEVGGRGQERLLDAAVRADEAGGAAAVALLYLAAAGVGTLVVTDRAPVGEADRWLYLAADVGRPRLEAARERLAALNPDVRVLAEGTGRPLGPLAADPGDPADPADPADPISELERGAKAAARLIRELAG